MLTCPKCHGKMKILNFIKDGEIIKKILKYLGLWEVKARSPAKANTNILCITKPWFNT